MERTRTEQRQCPMCRAVFCHETNTSTHFANERERLAYGMITGLKVPNEFVKLYAEDLMELGERMQDLGFNLSEPDFKDIENVKKDRKNKLEGGKKLADIPHSGMRWSALKSMSIISGTATSSPVDFQSAT